MCFQSVPLQKRTRLHTENQRLVSTQRDFTSILKKKGVLNEYEITTVYWLLGYRCRTCMGCDLFYRPVHRESKEDNQTPISCPDILKGNAEYLSLIEDWRSVEKMDSWTSEHSLAEDRLKRKFRRFLIKDLSETENVLDIPIVAIALQSTRILIEHHHTRVESLDWDLASFSRLQIMHIMNKDLIR